MEDELHIAISQLISVILKTHEERTLQFVELIYHQILPKVLNPTYSDKMHQFGVFLVIDMIEFINIDLI